MDESLNAPFRDFVALFERLGIPSALIGGLAVSVHGIPRPTHDLDFTIALDRIAHGVVAEFARTLPCACSCDSYDTLRLNSCEFSYDTLSPCLREACAMQARPLAPRRVAGMPLIRVRQWLRGQSVDIDIFLG